MVRSTEAGGLGCRDGSLNVLQPLISQKEDRFLNSRRALQPESRLLAAAAAAAHGASAPVCVCVCVGVTVFFLNFQFPWILADDDANKAPAAALRTPSSSNRKSAMNHLAIPLH
jgi:hypothetical protein